MERAVVKGYVQMDKAYYNDTIAQAVPFGALHLTFWEDYFSRRNVRHADISTAFLNGENDVELYPMWDSVLFSAMRD